MRKVSPKALRCRNTGSARSLASAPEVPKTSDAPRVTKLPVTWAVKRPFSARKAAVSMNPALTLSMRGSPSCMIFSKVTAKLYVCSTR